jgi:hypothetical protein
VLKTKKGSNTTMKHWQTTLFGALAAAGTLLQGGKGVLGLIGHILVVAGTLGLGTTAADASQVKD